MTPDVLIVGAGIVGAACARELKNAGVKVAVVERDLIGGGATAAGMGHLVVLDDNEPELALTQLSVALWHSLAPELPATAEFWKCGTLWVAADESELAGAREKLAVYRANGLPAELLDSDALYEAEPRLRPGLAGGLRAMGDAVVYAPVAARWLLGDVRVTHGRVVELVDGGVRLADGSVLRAGAVVLATGASSLIDGLAVRPRKGHLAITDRYPGFARHQIIELGYLQSAQGESSESVAFNVQPRPTGQLLIGSSRQYGVTDGPIDPPMLARMLERAFSYMPDLARCNVIRAWTGFRASTPDKLPLIGKYGEGLFLATGHEGLGVTTSLGTAKILAAAVLGTPSPIPPEPYDARRFCARND
ncbi:MAG: FAD-binding oxidoreductase [Acidobacteria bacterium]|nr:FAD-binding oxidoreductase [Acidobacteriota bacterium]